MQLNVLNDLAEAMKALDGKKILRTSDFFFPSSLADVALRLGPYMSISCQTDICTRTSMVRKSRQIKTNQKTHKTNNQDRRKSKPISPKVYAQLLNTKRKRKVHEVSKPMASLSLIPFPFALHSLSSSRSAVTHGHHKPKQGREVSYTNSSQVHKVSP